MESRSTDDGEAQKHPGPQGAGQWISYIIILVLLCGSMVITGFVVFPLLIIGYVTLIFFGWKSLRLAGRHSTTRLRGVTITTPLPLRQLLLVIVVGSLLLLLLVEIMALIVARSH